MLLPCFNLTSLLCCPKKQLNQDLLWKAPSTRSTPRRKTVVIIPLSGARLVRKGGKLQGPRVLCMRMSAIPDAEVACSRCWEIWAELRKGGPLWGGKWRGPDQSPGSTPGIGGGHGCWLHTVLLRPCFVWLGRWAVLGHAPQRGIIARPEACAAGSWLWHSHPHSGIALCRLRDPRYRRSRRSIAVPCRIYTC